MSTILIGVDSTARSEDAVEFTRQLAQATNAEIVVASIVPGPAAPGSPAHEDATRTVRRMSGFLHGVEPGRIRVGIVDGSSPARGLDELATVEEAALLVVGSTHTGRLGRIRPGSTAERLLAGAPCSVAVVPFGYHMQRDASIERIGVAYDNSPGSHAALDAAVATARALGAALEVITVIPADIYGAPALMLGAGYVGVRANVEADIRKDLAAVVTALPSDVSPTGVVLRGQPWRELAHRSADLDLLLIGSRGYGPLEAVLLGGTSGPLMREAQCPVIALPRGIGTSLIELFATDTVAAA